MPTYVMLGNYTDQGIRNVKDTTKRAEAFRTLAQKLGCTAGEILWVHGHYDMVAIVDAPDAAAMTSLSLSLAKLGNVRHQTLRAFSAAELGPILDKVE